MLLFKLVAFYRVVNFIENRFDEIPSYNISELSGRYSPIFLKHVIKELKLKL